ncbi:siderophore-interacting protein [Arthrobacter sp. Br18]|uniref:siderophore-interacting protein n=1 Tax=Arthrobacter sp. Br18 TaxID=1312954 RepID=UPI00047D1172|nr:siderophore-interacting protein [Arthrobacter sp. Br18]
MTRVSEKAVQRTAAVPAVAAFDVAVARVERVGANFQRITFSGACLNGFGVAGPLLDLRIKVIIPADGRPCPDIGALMQGGGESAGWYQQWLGLEPDERGSMRTYTVRDFRAHEAEPEIDVDFVLHFDDDGTGGPASQWAAKAAPGDRVCLIGPNVAAAQCTTAGSCGGIEWSPGLAQHVLLVGDETAVPAICAILESLPAHVGGDAFLEVSDPADIQEVSTASSVRITWLARGAREHGELLDQAVRTAVRVPGWVSLAKYFVPGTAGARTRNGTPGTPGARTRNGQAGVGAPGSPGGTSALAGPEPEEVDIDRTILWETPQRLEASVLEATPNPGRLPGSQPFYAWIAGEAALVRGLRRYLVRDVGIDRKQVAFMGYWRKGRSELA